MVFAIGPEIARGAGGGSIHAVVGDPSKVAKVMSARDIKEVLVQMYVNRLDPSLAPMIYSYGQVSRTKMMYVIMDKIDGTLETRMHSGWRPGCRDVALIASLVRRLHKIGVAHYDLHPGNIGFKGKVPKLIDFGWAEIAPGEITAATNASIAANAEVRNAKKKPFLNHRALNTWGQFCSRGNNNGKNNNKPKNNNRKRGQTTRKILRV